MSGGVSRERVFRGRIALVLTAIVTIEYCVFLLPISWILLPIPFVWVRRQYRRWVSTVQLLLLGFLGYAVEFICQIRIVITGADELLHVLPARPLIVSNHRSEIDWLFLVCLSLRLHRLSVLKVTTMESWTRLPFVGWLMQVFTFPPLCARDKVKDLATLRNCVEYLVGVQRPIGGCSFALFPESAFLSSPNARDKSERYAEILGLPVWKNVLVPRVPGIYETIRSLNRLNALDSVIDVTVGYLDFDPVAATASGLLSFWTGKFPREVHMGLNQIRWADLPADNIEATRSWLIDLFARKERMLEKFYAPLHIMSSNDYFLPTELSSGEEDQLSTTSTHMSNLATLLCFHDDDGDSPEPADETLSKDMRFIQYISNSYVISAVVATMVTCLVTVTILAYPRETLVYILSVCLTFSFITRWIDGFNVLELDILPVQVDLTMSPDFYSVDPSAKPKTFIQQIKELFSPPKSELESGQSDKGNYIRAIRQRKPPINRQ